MAPLFPIINQALATLTIIGQIVIAAIISVFIFRNKPFAKIIFKFFAKKALLFSFIVAAIATAGSLFYSEIVGLEPCKLCWFQRIMMYPQVIFLGLALKKKDSSLTDYLIPISLLGAAIAAYHYLLQIGFFASSACSATGYSVSCVSNFKMIFGYITIPLMALTAFLLILFFFISEKLYNKYHGSFGSRFIS